ncbi:MAG: hypothetical protein ACK4K7_10530 [Allosphingosinicella sp.]|uniref:hypothetical protein n=1 Tax=Allosphingosinicella sp. TaxID=2823234 RepID=UPI00393B6BC5
MTQAGLWAGAGASAAMVLVAALADRARQRRRDLDAPGWMPWPAIQVFALLLAVVLAALAVKTG